MTVIQPSANQLQITLQQGAAEVAAFIVISALIGGALAFGVPMPLSSRLITLLVVLLLAGGWGVYAIGCSEEYSFDREAGRYVIARRTPLGVSERAGSLGDLAFVNMEVGGPDDNRRLVVLVELTGRRITLPRRINTLSEADQRELGRTVADFLSLPLKRMR